ncbi:MAG: RnfABCDGE type electron transport complex subunit B [Desulfobacterales bacterium]|nr:RnfABCDGE type electron transport complex subunit B [Desulfobacterales bacterium]
MVEAITVMGILGLMIGVMLAVAAKVFYVYVDPLILEVEAALPGANCGGCGKPGCSANAAAIAAGKATPDSCVAAGPDVAEAIAAIMGVKVELKEPDIAKPGCIYGAADADLKYIYNGLNDCRAVALLSGGMKVCSIGCLGLGTCARACPFNAITMGPKGLPVVSEKRCTGCGTCERVCPKNIITMSSITRRIMREYTTAECTTPCQRACPAGIDIREYIHQIDLGDFHKAVQVIKERNPFPTVIGRICPRPCEQDCRRQFVDEPVAINFLKRYAADYEKKQGKRILPYKAPATGRRVAVIGGGVEGLSAAFFTARLGHDPTVFEAAKAPGGLLRSAIAAYRLPREMLDWDIDGIREIGVRIETEKTLGKDFTVASLLREGYEAVFLATGGWDSRLLRNPEPQPTIPGTHLLIDYIRNRDSITCGDHVVICGGSRLAVEAARKCQTASSQNITILFRETREKAGLDDAEFETLEKEGVKIRFATAVSRLSGRENRLTELESVDLLTRSQETIPVDTLVLASGRLPEFIFVKPPVEETEETAQAADGVLHWQALETYKEPANKAAVGIIAPNDVKTDFSAAIRAIGAGRRAAASIHQAMYGIPITLPDTVVTPQSDIQNVDRIDRVPAISREIMPLSSPKELAAGRELEKGFSEASASSEAQRCLQCGLICYLHDGNRRHATG